MSRPKQDTSSDKVIDRELTDADEKEVLMQAFDKVRRLFEKRSWIMDGRGSYRYDDDRYKEEVRYLYDEFDALQKETWNNIKSKSFEYRKNIIADYLKNSKTSTELEALKKENEALKERISELRNDLYDSIPTGKIEAFVLIRIIINHIKSLDELTNK